MPFPAHSILMTCSRCMRSFCHAILFAMWLHCGLLASVCPGPHVSTARAALDIHCIKTERPLMTVHTITRSVLTIRPAGWLCKARFFQLVLFGHLSMDKTLSCSFGRRWIVSSLFRSKPGEPVLHDHIGTTVYCGHSTNAFGAQAFNHTNR